MKKRKYTRPDVKISEWDFNESVCDTTVYKASYCTNLIVPSSPGVSAIENRNVYDGGSLDWNLVDKN